MLYPSARESLQHSHWYYGKQSSGSAYKTLEIKNSDTLQLKKKEVRSQADKHLAEFQTEADFYSQKKNLKIGFMMEIGTT